MNKYVSVCKCSTWIRGVPGYLKTKEMCDEAVRMELYSLEFVPGVLETKEMRKEALSNKDTR